jgi:integrase
MSAQAPSTRLAYAHGWRQFAAWCDSIGRGSLPASQDTLRLYIVDHLDRHAVATIEQHIAAVVDKHRSQKVPPPYEYEARELMRGARREQGRPPRQKHAITPEDLRKICGVLAREGTAQAARDRAVVTLGFAGAMRRSEIAALDIEDLRFTAKGVAVAIRRGKTDQESHGREVGIFYGKHARSCPVRALRAHLCARGRHAGALFSTLKGRRKRLRPESIARIVKNGIRKIGLDPRVYGAHSLRAGCITAAITAGVPDSLVAKRSGHRSLQTLAGYVRPATLFSYDILRKAM